MILDLQHILFRISITNFGKAITAFHKKQIPTALDLSYLVLSQNEMEHLTKLFSSNSYAELKGHYSDPAPALTFRESGSITTRIERYVKSKISNYQCEKAAKEFLKYKANITKLDLTLTHIEGKDVPYLAKLISSQKFTYIDLRQSLFTNDEAATLIKSLLNISHSITVDLSNGKHLDEGFVTALLPSLKGAAHPITVKLHRDHIQDGEYPDHNVVIKDGVLQYDPHLFERNANLLDLEAERDDDPDGFLATTLMNWSEDEVSLYGAYAEEQQSET